MQGLRGVHPGRQHALGCSVIFLAGHSLAEDFRSPDDFERLEQHEKARLLLFFLLAGEFERLWLFGCGEPLRGYGDPGLILGFDEQEPGQGELHCGPGEQERQPGELDCLGLFDFDCLSFFF